jgi:hypothetical protein
MTKKSEPERVRRTKPVTFSLAEEDNARVDWLADHWGCSRSEAVRTALRVSEALQKRK